jgi:hypothetical protein
MKVYSIILIISLFCGAITGLLINAPPETVKPDAPEITEETHFTFSTPTSVKRVKARFDLSAEITPEAGAVYEFYLDYKDNSNFVSIGFAVGTCTYTLVEDGVPVVKKSIPCPIKESTPVTVFFEVRGWYGAVYAGDTFVTDIPLDIKGESQLGLGKGIDPKALTYVPAEPPYLKDDFMRVEGETGEWNVVSGDWSIESRENPSMSANGFSFKGKGKDAIALIGSDSWNNYYFNISVNSPEQGKVGFITSYRDKDNYTLWSWDKDGINLATVRGGEKKTEWKKEKGLRPKQWYRIKGFVSRHILSLYVDDHLVAMNDTPAIRRGKFGLFINGEGYAHFDDADIGKITARKLTSNQDGILPFNRIGGKWEETSDGFTCIATDMSKAVWGDKGWSNYGVTATLARQPKGNAGVGLYYKGEDSFYYTLCDFEESRLRLVSRVNGKNKLLAAYPLPGTDDKIELKLSVYNSIITLEADGSRICSLFNRDHIRGKPFLFGSDCFRMGFDDVEVAFREYVEPVRSENEIFTAEYTMAAWAGSKSDWLSEKEIFKNNTIVTLWNKASFPGDVLLEANIEKMKNKGKVRLMVGAPERKMNSGYSFGITHNGSTKALLLKKEARIAEKVLARDKEYYRIGFQKVGNTVLGLLDGEIVLSHEDSEDPILGTNAGWTVAGEGLSREDIWAYSSSVFDYKFTRSPSDWRVASGTWKVTNRWQCDPRWTFFSGYTYRGNAVIWNKRKFKGDVTVEFYAAIKMDRARGSKYGYASDINCVISSDGKNASSGYNFLFGGYQNQKSCITRNKEIVASTSRHVIPIGLNIHRRWFYLRVEKRGNKLIYYIDGTKVLEYTDPKPLTGDRIGFWTYNNGIMVSRVRISSESGAEFESPFEVLPKDCKTVYE